MDVVYFETKTRNRLIYILTYIEDKNNKMLFNSRNWIAIVLLMSNSV